MTKVILSKADNRIVKVKCSGHTGYADSGEDIVCAALSSMVQTAALGILQVLQLDALYTVDDRKGLLELKLPTELTAEESHDAAIVLNTLEAGLRDLWQGYPQFIELEVK